MKILSHPQYLIKNIPQKNIKFSLNKLQDNNNPAIKKAGIYFTANKFENGWMIINDNTTKKEHYENNKLHILFEKGKPKICLRVQDNKLITDIQGEEGNNIIPICYLNDIDKYIQKNNLNSSFTTNYKISQAQRRAKRYPQEFYQKICDAVKKEDLKTFFKILNIEYDPKTKTIFGNLDFDRDIYELDSLNLGEVMQDCGITFEELFSKIKKIEGKLSTYYADFRSLGTIEEISGDTEICNNKKIISLGNLKKVGGNINLTNCEKLKSLGNLEEITKGINIHRTKIESSI